MDYEAIVIGGGFGGMTAARDLHDAGHAARLASGWCGWIHGAIESGHRAARATQEMLSTRALA